MLVKRTSQWSGVTREMDLPITEDQILMYELGHPIQAAFSNLSPSQREFILTGMTDEEWTEMCSGTWTE